MTSSFARPRRNPFSTAFVRPGALPFIFPQGVTAASLIDRLSQSGWRGQIVGPHGSGKTTLLHSVLPRLRDWWRVRWFTMKAGQRRLPVSRSDRLSWDGSTLVVVDGYEQLSWWQRTRLRINCRRQSCGLLVTSHSDSGLPVIFTTTACCKTTRKLVRLLLPNSDPQLVEARVHEAFHACQGNVRETLFKLYDWYESQQNTGSDAARPTSSIFLETADA